MKNYGTMREIGIDAGHRIPNHFSKCKSLHGHRYTIQASAKGAVETEGSSEGMVVDFSFLKEEMLREIDDPCDHGLILWWKDPLVRTFLSDYDYGSLMELLPACGGGFSAFSPLVGKLYIIQSVPTAENLAKHWFERLHPRVKLRSGNNAVLVCVNVWETPNCMATYPFGEE